MYLARDVSECARLLRESNVKRLNGTVTGVAQCWTEGRLQQNDRDLSDVWETLHPLRI